MTKPDTVKTVVPAVWQDKRSDDVPDTQQKLTLTTQMMNVMEQGIIVWSATGTCELHNTRVFDVMELNRDALRIGTDRDAFLAAAHARGEFSDAVFAENRDRFATRVAFHFDCELPSGRVVATYARPTREGGYVVTSTDVTEAREAAAELALAKQAAEIAEAKARAILQDERARRAEARSLSDLDEWLQSCKSLDELFRIVSKFMAWVTPGGHGSLYLFSNTRDVLDGACVWGTPIDMADHIAPDSCWALRRGRTYVHAPDELCFPCDHVHHDDPHTVGDYICIPVIAHGDTVGLMHLQFRVGMTDADIIAGGKFAGLCAQRISMAIANVKLRDQLQEQSTRDPLTGLYNRRFFMNAMRREGMTADREKWGYGLMLIDADKFKSFNDDHGHESGDLVLKGLSDRMVLTLPKTAICARMGGEEFAVLLPKATLEDTVEAANTVRQAISELAIRTSFGKLPRVTVSVGVTAYESDGTLPGVLLKLADQALYLAKANGRNCVEVATDLLD